MLSQYQEINTLKSTESTILLNMVETIANKSKTINKGRVRIFNNNKKLMKAIIEDDLKEI